MVRSKGNMSLKNPVTPPGIDPGTVRKRSALTTTPPQAPRTYIHITKIRHRTVSCPRHYGQLYAPTAFFFFFLPLTINRLFFLVPGPS
jgi:hypothetical protein